MAKTVEGNNIDYKFINGLKEDQRRANISNDRERTVLNGYTPAAEKMYRARADKGD